MTLAVAGTRALADAHLLLFGAVLPLLVFRSHRKLQGGRSTLPEPKRQFRSTTVELLVFLAFSLLVAWGNGIDLFPREGTHLGRGLLAGAALYVLAVVFMRPRWRRAVERRAPIVSMFMPRDATERTWWVLVSVIAGVGEEITWRGVQTQLLLPIAGTYLAASVVCALSFGLAHFIQGWKSAALIVVFALGFQAVVWASGSLYFAMLVHVAYDLTAGLSYGKIGRELGYKAGDRPVAT